MSSSRNDVQEVLQQALKRKDERREGGENRRGSRRNDVRVAGLWQAIQRWCGKSLAYCVHKLGDLQGGGACSQQKFLQIRRSEITSLAILGSNMPGFPYIVAACPRGVEYT